MWFEFRYTPEFIKRNNYGLPARLLRLVWNNKWTNMFLNWLWNTSNNRELHGGGVGPMLTWCIQWICFSMPSIKYFLLSRFRNPLDGVDANKDKFIFWCPVLKCIYGLLYTCIHFHHYIYGYCLLYARVRLCALRHAAFSEYVYGLDLLYISTPFLSVYFQCGV